MSIDVYNRYHFKQSHDDQTDGAGEGVEHLQPVFSSASCKDQTHEETKSADRTLCR